MLAPGKIQRKVAALTGRHDAAGEHAGAVVTGLALHLQHPHARVVVVHRLALRRLADELVVRRFEERGHVFDNLPLRCRRQRNPQLALQFFQPVERHATSVFELGDHRAYCFVVLFRTHALWLLRRKDLPASATA